MPQQERRGLRRVARLAMMVAMERTASRLGRFPSRALRMGSDDEASAYVHDLARFARKGRWTSADGSVDYLASLDEVTVPLLQIVSVGDRLACRPEEGAFFLDRCAGPRELVRVDRADDGGPPPGHMGIVTSGRISSVWERVERWMRAEGLAPGAF
jgi:hypothetical protein